MHSCIFRRDTASSASTHKPWSRHTLELLFRQLLIRAGNVENLSLDSPVVKLWCWTELSGSIVAFPWHTGLCLHREVSRRLLRISGQQACTWQEQFANDRSRKTVLHLPPTHTSLAEPWLSVSLCDTPWRWRTELPLLHKPAGGRARFCSWRVTTKPLEKTQVEVEVVVVVVVVVVAAPGWSGLCYLDCTCVLRPRGRCRPAGREVLRWAHSRDATGGESQLKSRSRSRSRSKLELELQSRIEQTQKKVNLQQVVSSYSSSIE